MESVVGRGTLLAGRYRTLQPLASDLPGASTWEATDQILDRPVRVTVLHAGQVPQALDAARRAALVTDPRLVRVLDVGEHEGVSYTVTEQVSGPSLDELVARGPLPADQARAIVGEAAAALEAARRRGVHHLALRPSTLHLTPDDRVLLTGLAVDSALLGQDATDAAAASRADTVGLVELLYAALTGRWPGTTRRAGAGPLPHLAAAPVLEGAPVPPAELASGVPNDLDTLCAVTLGVHDDGPQSPAELVQELEPWGDIRATDLFAATQVLPTAPSAPRTSPTDSPTDTPTGSPTDTVPTADVPAAPTRVQRTSVRTAFAGGSSAIASRPGTPPPAVPSRAPAFGGAASTPARGRPDDTPTTAVPAADAAPTAALRPTAEPRPAAAAPAAPRDTPAAATAATARVPAVEPSPTPPSARAGTAPAAAAPASAPRAPAPRAPAPQAPARPAPARPAPARPARPAARPSTAAASAAGGTSGAGAAVDPVDRPPLLPLGPRPGGLDVAGARESIAAHRFDPTRLVLLIVGLAIVIGLFTAYRALTQPVGPPVTGPDPAATESVPAPDPAAEEPAEEPPAEPEPEPEAPATTPVIASAAQLDPPPGGDENEHPEAVPLAIDGDPSTVWFTRTYNQPNFGGLKPGVGYAVTLAEPAVVTTVTLDVLGSGGRVEVRATDPTTPTEGEILAEGPLGPGTVLTLAQPTEAQHVVLWFTELPQTADGANRIELAEVTLS